MLQKSVPLHRRAIDKLSIGGCWQFSDLTQEHKDTKKMVFGGNGLVSRQGIPKCGYFAFWLLSKLGTELLDCGENHIVTRTDNGGYAVLVHNYKCLSDAYCTEYFRTESMIPGDRLFEDVVPLHFDYTVGGVEPGQYTVKKYNLNAYHGNLADMISELNCWELAREEEIAYLSGTCVPRQRISSVRCEDSLRLESTLEPLEVVLFVADRSFH